jgi:universal stress protein A
MSTQLQRILCATDFSAPAREAFDQAVALARATGAELTLMHVAAAPFPMVLGPEAQKYFAASTDASVKALAQWKQHAVDHGCPRVEAVHVAGVPWERIIARAQDHADDLVVLGTHGRVGLTRALLGSVAERVVRHAPCSVLVTRAA